MNIIETTRILWIKGFDIKINGLFLVSNFKLKNI